VIELVMIFVYVMGKKVAQGKEMKSILKFTLKLVKEGYTDIIISGGRIGTWR
jgi:uncharacterized radical SAM superfamily protein